MSSIVVLESDGYRLRFRRPHGLTWFGALGELMLLSQNREKHA
jgi:hypothetical protein